MELRLLLGPGFGRGANLRQEGSRGEMGRVALEPGLVGEVVASVVVGGAVVSVWTVGRSGLTSSSEVAESASSEKLNDRCDPVFEGCLSNDGPLSTVFPLASPPLKLLLAFCKMPPVLALLQASESGAPVMLAKAGACMGGGVMGDAGLPSDEEE